VYYELTFSLKSSHFPDMNWTEKLYL
jgi:hypothetical protein